MQATHYLFMKTKVVILKDSLVLRLHPPIESLGTRLPKGWMSIIVMHNSFQLTWNIAEKQQFLLQITVDFRTFSVACMGNLCFRVAILHCGLWDVQTVKPFTQHGMFKCN